MFGLLKNKLSSFINSLAGREEKKPEAKPVEKPAEIKEEQPPLPKPIPTQEPKQPIHKQPHVQKPLILEERKPACPAEPIQQQHAQTPATHEEKKPVLQKPEPKPAIFEAKKHEPKPEIHDVKKPEQQKHEPKPEIPEVKKPEQPKHQAQKPVPAPPAQTPALPPVPQKPVFEEKKPPVQPKPAFEEKRHIETPKPAFEISDLARRAASEKREIAPKIGLGATIKSFFSNEITIGEGEVNDLLEELELSLLEADVAYEVSLEVTSQLRNRLVGMKMPKKEVGERIKGEVRLALEGVMTSDRKFDLLSRVRGMKKPVKIIFVGTNGAGKTTTIAKVARMLMDAKLSVIFSASDTFRAAAIEQTEVHAERLGVKVIKGKYGSDPASVAFDAINFATAHGIDVVLIDSAGRQDTNANLLDELRKINRVAKPDIRIYVGESIGGNSVIEQIRAFDGVIPMDGAILTKIDCDAKGGTAISITKTTGIPILYLGVGQGYSDLVPFDAHRLAQEIMN